MDLKKKKTDLVNNGTKLTFLYTLLTLTLFTIITIQSKLCLQSIVRKPEE